MGLMLRFPPGVTAAPGTLDVEAVVFDLDGLLIDSEGLAAEAWRITLAPYGATISDNELDAMLGKRIVDDAAELIARHKLPISIEALVARRGEVTRTLVRDALQPMPGAVTLVRRLAARGVPLALATSGLRWYAEQCLDVIGLRALFAVCITADDVSRGKPAPDVYLAAAAGLGLAPSACLALEDAPLGVAAALAAGMPVIAVPNDFTRKLPFPPGVVRAISLLEVTVWMNLE
jgi:HAD superfamily hydrolase (TIGR01509 family)